MIERPLVSGWYLMSPADLEVELRAWRDPESRVPPSNAEAIHTDAALTRRNEGNLPDDADRTLRLVLVLDRMAPGEVEVERLRFEPDYHDAPSWRREGSKPVNVVPLRIPGANTPPSAEAWWQEETMAAFESEWETTGSVDGIAIPAEWRGFVFKTIAALRAVERDVSVDSIADSVARWLAPDETERLRAALRQANP